MINSNDVNLVIFDMDGTIVPSLPIVYEAIKRAFDGFGWELAYSAEDINQFIGTVSGELYKSIIPPEHFSQWPELRDRTRAEYAALFRESAETFPGVRETLATLRKRGYKLVLYSNASTLYFDMVTSALNILDYFDHAECVQENNLTKTELVRKIRERFGGSTAAIVGDRYHDVNAARETDSLSIGVFFGYGGNEPEQADIAIKSFKELLSIFDRRLPIFEKILGEIDRRKPKDRPFVVGITGIDSSGKTEFTRALADYLTSANYKVQVINLDDFHNPKKIRYDGDDPAYNYYRRSFNISAVIENLLIPIHQKGEHSVTLKLLDLNTDTYDINREYYFDADTIVLFEGVFLFRKELAGYIDLKVFLEIPFSESKRRAVERDPEVVLNKYDTKYLPAQARYLEEYPPRDSADIIIDNTDREFPSIKYSR